ncbi:EamA family transporter [candidate division KSB1 bacterium]|nr:EamA family transporter [candidate division KSB1 bacterium]
MRILLAYSALCLIWGTTYLALKVALEGFAPYFMGGTRFLLAGILLLPSLFRRQATMPEDRRQLGLIALSGLLMLTGANGLVNLSEVYLDSGLTALTVSTAPVWSALIGGWFFSKDERFDRWSAVGCGLAVLGMVVLHHHRLNPEHVEWPGVIAACAAPVFWSVGSLIARTKVKTRDFLVATTIQMFAASVGFFLISLLLGESWHPQLTARVVSSMLYLIVVGSVVAYATYVWLLNHLPASRVGTYAYVNPIIALIVGHLILSEPIHSEVYPASLLILGGLVLMYYMHTRISARAAEGFRRAGTASPPE